MNFFKYILFFILASSFSAIAEESDIENYYEANIVLQTIDTMEKDGFITNKNALEAKQQYVFKNADLKERMIDYVNSQSKDKNIDSTVSFTDYITLVNFIKFIAAIALIVAFHGVIAKVSKHFIDLIIAVPQFLYQIVFLSLGLTLTIHPDLIWASEAFYLAFIGSFINLIILGWIFLAYEKICLKILSVIAVGMNKHVLLSLYITLYFGILAIIYKSSAFGLLSIIALVSATGFVVFHSKLCTALGVNEEESLPIVIGSNLLILVSYSLVRIFEVNVPYLEYFIIGIEYACSLALGICLLIASAPFRNNRSELAYSILMIIISVAAFLSSTLFGLTVIGAFINTCFVFFLLEYLVYFTYKVHYIFMAFLSGIALYGLGLYIEANPHYFVNSLF